MDRESKRAIFQARWLDDPDREGDPGGVLDRILRDMMDMMDPVSHAGDPMDDDDDDDDDDDFVDAESYESDDDFVDEKELMSPKPPAPAAVEKKKGDDEMLVAAGYHRKGDWSGALVHYINGIEHLLNYKAILEKSGGHEDILTVLIPKIEAAMSLSEAIKARAREPEPEPDPPPAYQPLADQPPADQPPPPAYQPPPPAYQSPPPAYQPDPGEHAAVAKLAEARANIASKDLQIDALEKAGSPNINDDIEELEDEKAVIGSGILPLLEEIAGSFEPPAGVLDPLANPNPANEDIMRTKYAEFYRAGGRVIVMPDEDVATDAMEAGLGPPVSIGIHPGDFLIPVCHQGMNRSQIMRLVLTGVIGKLYPADNKGTMTEWVSRAHGAVSGCDAHSAYGPDNGMDYRLGGPLKDENRFFAYIFDKGDIFAPDYKAKDDKDPQEGPLQRGFESTFGQKKQSRIGEEMALVRELNPTSDITHDREFKNIGINRTYTHDWFNKWVFASPEEIWSRLPPQEDDAPLEQLTLPPQGTTRRIYFCFARAADGVIDRLLEAKGCHNSVVISLDYKDNMNNSLRHCQGKTAEELEQAMYEVHLKTYYLYASMIHADPSPGPPWQEAPEPDPAPVLSLAPAPAPVPEPEPETDISRMRRHLEQARANSDLLRNMGQDVSAIETDIAYLVAELAAAELAAGLSTAEKAEELAAAERQRMVDDLLTFGFAEGNIIQALFDTGYNKEAAIERLLALVPVTHTPIAPAPIAQAPVAPAPIARAPIARAPIAWTPVAPAPVAPTPITQVPRRPGPGGLGGLGGLGGIGGLGGLGGPGGLGRGGMGGMGRGGMGRGSRWRRG